MSAGADGSRLSRTKSKRKSCRTTAIAIRFGVRACCAKRKRTASLAIHLSFAATAPSTVAERSARSRSCVTWGSSRFGFSRRPSKIASDGSCSRIFSSSDDAERERLNRSAADPWIRASLVSSDGSCDWGGISLYTGRDSDGGFSGADRQLHVFPLRYPFGEFGIDGCVEKLRPPVHAADQGDRHGPPLPVEPVCDARSQRAKRARRRRKDLTRNVVAFVRRFGDKWNRAR